MTKDLAKQYMKDRMRRNWRGCWLWQGALNTNGYAYIKFAKWEKGISVHRMAMHLWKDFELNSVLNVCHTCDVRHCFNPSHLWVGTQSENIVDGFKKGRMEQGERHANSKLKNSDVITILKALEEKNVTQRELASRFKIAESAITKLKQRKTWKHLCRKYDDAKLSRD